MKKKRQCMKKCCCKKLCCDNHNCDCCNEQCCCNKESCCKNKNKCESFCSERKWCITPCNPCCEPCDPPIVPPIDPPKDPCCCKPCCNSCCNICCNSCCTCKKHCKREESGSLVPQSFGLFANNKNTTIPAGTPMTFNQVGTGTNDIILTSPSTIKVKTAGVYKIVYSVGINVPATGVGIPSIEKYRVAIYINFEKQHHGHKDLTQTPGTTAVCTNLVGSLTACVGQNSVITLMNESQEIGGGAITTCSNGTNPIVLSITRIR
ncbi:MAG: hypothetical protein ACRC57_07065 [Sarcina sp.]